MPISRRSADQTHGQGFPHLAWDRFAATALQAFAKVDSQAGAKKNIKVAIQQVAARFGNPLTIGRKCYFHPEILNTSIEGSLLLDVKAKVEAQLCDDCNGLKPEEAAVLTLLQTRLSRTLEDKLGERVARAV